MKTIKGKILANTITSVAVSLLVVATTCIVLNYVSTQNLLEQTMTETVKVTAERVSQELQSYTNIAIESGSIARLAKDDTSVADKKSIVDQRVATHKLKYGNIIGADGKGIFDGADYSDREYFAAGMNGSTYISEPIVSQVTGELAMIISAPLWQNGIPGTNVVGVIYYLPQSTFLNDIMSTIKVSPTGAAYMI
ncbi:MAG: methyl-accepting chemotaxis protein, partial [Angelakisella sp.]